VIVLLAAVGLVAAGCGGGSSSSKPLTKAAYQAKLQQLSNGIGSQLSKSMGGSTKLEQSDVPKLQKALRSFAGEVEGLTPPVEVAKLHTRLVVALRRLADDVPALIGQVQKASDPSEAIAALLGAKSVQNLVALQQAYQARGYDISSLLNPS
jgi:hypothetical protein